jgi:acetyl-CoA acetyltransferase
MSPVDLMAQATRRALDDCGLSLSDIDGVFAATAQVRFAPMMLSEYLGLNPRYIDGTQIGGSSFMSHLAHAVAAIELGLCEVALIAYGSTQRSVSRKAASPTDINPYETPFRALTPVSAYAFAAARHMHQFGTTREQLADVAVAARQWALLNPVAWEKEPLSREQVLSSRMISDPLTLRDCCLVLDGGGAMIVTSAARARDCKKLPIHVLGTGEAIGHGSISNMHDLTTTAAAISGPRAYEAAGIGAGDVDVALLYDAFTITPILFLEDLGFCAKGEGPEFVRTHSFTTDGDFPLNTSGGQLSVGQAGAAGGYLGLTEAVRQLTGAPLGARVPNARTALVSGFGMINYDRGLCCGAAILAGDAAL